MKAAISSIPTMKDCGSDWYWHWSDRIAQDTRPARKMWEFAAIMQAIDDRTTWPPASACVSCIGFGVGREPLPALLASCGYAVLATDQVITARNAREHWADSGQLSQSADDLRWPAVCHDSTFDANVCFANVDMKNIPHGYDGKFDFAWSAGSLEHLGDLAAGEEFIRRSVECLRPGGWAVHTTEFNLELNGSVCESGDTCFYRASDLHAMADRFRADGHIVEPFDFQRGDTPIDTYIEYEPYTHPVEAFALEACGVITTSAIIIIQRAL